MKLAVPTMSVTQLPLIHFSHGSGASLASIPIEIRNRIPNPQNIKTDGVLLAVTAAVAIEQHESDDGAGHKEGNKGEDAEADDNEKSQEICRCHAVTPSHAQSGCF